MDDNDLHSDDLPVVGPSSNAAVLDVSDTARASPLGAEGEVTLAEAAAMLNLPPTLLLRFVSHQFNGRKLECLDRKRGRFKRSEVEEFRTHLESPWSEEKRKPPDFVERYLDIEAEAAGGCASCRQRSEKYQYAHVVPWEKTHCHSPHNLLRLCPTCHSSHGSDVPRLKEVKDIVRRLLWSSQIHESERRTLRLKIALVAVGTVLALSLGCAALALWTKQRTVNIQQDEINQKQGRINTQQVEINSQQRTINTQQVEINSQQQALNAQQAQVNALTGQLALATKKLLAAEVSRVPRTVDVQRLAEKLKPLAGVAPPMRPTRVSIEVDMAAGAEGGALADQLLRAFAAAGFDTSGGLVVAPLTPPLFKVEITVPPGVRTVTEAPALLRFVGEAIASEKIDVDLHPSVDQFSEEVVRVRVGSLPLAGR